MATADPEILADELLRVKEYPFNNGKCGEAPLRVYNGFFTYQRAAEELIKRNDSYSLSVGLWAFTRCAPPHALELTLPDGRTCHVREVLLEAIRLNPQLSFAFNTLSARMQDFVNKKKRSANDEVENTVRLFDGRCLDARELLIEAIRIRPEMSLFYDNLAGLLSEKETAALHDGRRLSRNDLFVEAIRLDATDIYTYVNFASVLNATKIIKLADGREMDHKALACEALKLKPTFGAAYYSIASKMKDTSPGVQIFNNETLWTQRDLCLEALRYTPDMYQPYTVLARMTGRVNKTDLLRLHDGRELTRAQLFVQAAKFDTTGFVMKHMAQDDKAACFWSPAQHKAFGPAANRIMATFLLCLARLERLGMGVSMDPAVLEESLQPWSLADTADAIA